MYLSRLRLRDNRAAIRWLSNLYHVHQRIEQACEGDPRVLFRIEEKPDGETHILVQSHNAPHWETAFADLPVLRQPPECKAFEPRLAAGRRYRFRLLANPTVCKKTDERKPNGKLKQPRLGLLRQEDQRAWLEKKLREAGAELGDCIVIPRGMQRSHKDKDKSKQQTHLAVLFEGVLWAQEPDKLVAALKAGIGPAKGFGFGLLSLAPA